MLWRAALQPREGIPGRVFCSKLPSGAALGWCRLLPTTDVPFYHTAEFFHLKKCWTEVVAGIQLQSSLKNTQRAGMSWSWGCSLMLPKQGAVGNHVFNTSLAIRTAVACSVRWWGEPKCFYVLKPKLFPRRLSAGRVGRFCCVVGFGIFCCLGVFI